MLTSAFKKIDLFGKTYSFEEHGLSSYNTIFGGILTIVLAFAIVTVGFLFGKEVYERKRPQVNQSQEQIDKSNITISEFPLVISFYDLITGAVIRDIETILDIEMINAEIFLNSYPKISFFGGFIKCDIDKFSNYKDIVNSTINTVNRFNSSYCLHYEEGLYFSNSFATPNSRFLEIRLKKCDPKIRKCNENLSSRVSRFTVAIEFVNTYLDPSNFTNPIYYFKDTFVQTVESSSNKINYMRINKNILYSDNGWILEDTVNL